MIDKINTNQIQDFLEKPSSGQTGSVKNAQSNNADLSLLVNYASLIEKASQNTQTDPDAVNRAKLLLMSGKLDSPENIRAAAEEIAQSGI